LAPQPVALLGDAVHTAHFSVGSGTKMAMEDAVALSAALAAHPGDLAGALATYEEAAQPSVRKIQDSARPSLSWWEHFGRYHDAFEPWQFAYHFLSRSISDARLARRAPDFVAASHRGWVDTYGAEPLQTAFQRRGWSAPGRLVDVRTNGGRPVAVAGNASLPLGDPRPGPWGAVLAAPDSETGLPGVAAQLGELARLDIPPVLVAVHGGTTLTRMLVCEQIRLHERLPALLIDPDAADDAPTRDRAVTAVLSGRADLVGVPR
jgi:anthraniloyl-CoA monooxygenase